MRKSLVEVWQNLTRAERWRSGMIVLMLALAALLEMVGIGALFPVVAVMQQPGLVQENPWLRALWLRAGSPAQVDFFLGMLGALLLFYLAKNLFLVALDAIQYRFLTRVQSRLSTRLMSAYLARPYAFHLEHNSAQLIRNVTAEVTTVLYYAMVPMVTLTAEVLVLLALFALVVLVDPVAAVAFLVSGGVLAAGFYGLLRERNFRIGQQVQEHNGMMIQYAKEGLGGIKEVKVMGREAFFSRAFSQQAEGYGRALSNSLIVYKLPPHVLESVFVTFFVGVLALLALQQRAGAAISLMAVYAAAAFRVIPSLNRIMTALNLMRQGTSALRLVTAEIAGSRAQPARPEPAAPVAPMSELRVEGLSFRYAGAEQPAFEGIDLCIRRGEMVGFVGRSGSGKTTLIDCLLGLLAPSAGRILVDGVDIDKLGSAWTRQIGYIPQHIFLTDENLRRNVAIGQEDAAIDDAKVWRALESAQLGEFVRSLPEGLETRVGENGVRLSGGQRQRIGIARALYHDPGILVMDEATSALDPETERAFVETVAGLRGSKTVLIIAHRPGSLQACDRIVRLEDGRVVA
jgi:ATP-binding cassette subfamily C protein